MKNEFERKFLLTQDEVKDIFDKKWPYAVYNMFQGYFWTDEKTKEFRIRLYAQDTYESKLHALLTIKEIPKNIFDHSGDDREEVEFSISPTDGLYHIKNSCTKFLQKKCYMLHWKDGITFEIKVINERVNILEIEFPSKEEMDAYNPDFDFSTEVTNDRKFYSYNMATEYNKEELAHAIHILENKTYEMKS